IRVNPADASQVQVISNSTGTVASTRTNNSNQAVNVIGTSSSDTVVLVDETYGVVNVPITVTASGLPNDQFIVFAGAPSNGLVVTSTGAASANVTYGGSRIYSF